MIRSLRPPAFARACALASAVAMALAVGAAPTAVAAPTPCASTQGTLSFDGEARLGKTLRAIPHGWTVNPGPFQMTFDWYVGGILVQSSANDTYAPTVADLGAPLAVSLTLVSTTDPSCRVSGSRTTAAAQVKALLFEVPTVSIEGTATASLKLKVKVGSFGPVDPETVAIRWLRGGKPISRATAKTYTLTGDDVGQRISVRVTAKGTFYSTRKVTSAETGPVIAGTFSSATVKIKGTARVGAVLTAVASGKGVAKPTSFSYQWFRGGKKIKGATKATYEVRAGDVGKRLRVRAWAERDGFVKKRATSSKTRKIPKLPLWVDPRCMSGGAVLCIDKNAKDSKVRYIVNGKVKATFDARFGATGTPTREGVYSVYAKDRDCYSTLYHSSMPFALFFSGGQAVHYSIDFASRGYVGASHGCVNLRDREGARRLFNKVKIGTKVVVYH